MFPLGLCLLPSPTILLPVLVIHEWEKNALLWTSWEHSTWPNQSITLVGRRCVAAVQQHTISQSIRHKHMVTNQWRPEDPWEGCFSAVSMVHGWWLHNHTFILSKEKGDELPNNIPHHVNAHTVIDAASVGTAARSPRCIAHSRVRSSPTYSDHLRRGRGGATTAGLTSWRNLPRRDTRIKPVCIIKV